MSPRIAPCEWPIIHCQDADLEAEESETGCATLDGLEPVVRDAVVEMAVGHLWIWTGRTFGLCETTVRPCRTSCGQTTYRGRAWPASIWPGSGGFVPVLVDGGWLNLTCGTCGDPCSCGRLSEIILPGPAVEVLEVQVDGDVLDEDAYRLDNGGRLVRQDGKSWPRCQDLSKPDGEPGTWSVTYSRGVPVPKGGQIAAGKLACEMGKAVCGDEACGLPQRIQTVTREGVTVGIMDSFETLDEGLTGIWLIDSWLTSVTRPSRRSSVMSPDAKVRRTSVTVASPDA